MVLHPNSIQCIDLVVHNLFSEHQLDTSYRFGVHIVNKYINLLLISPYIGNNVPGIGAFSCFGQHDGGNVDGVLLRSKFDMGFSATRLQSLCLTACVLCKSLCHRGVWLAMCMFLRDCALCVVLCASSR